MGPPKLPDMKLIIAWAIFGMLCAIGFLGAGFIWIIDHVVIV